MVVHYLLNWGTLFIEQGFILVAYICKGYIICWIGVHYSLNRGKFWLDRGTLFAGSRRLFVG